jgi:3-hydroxyacyl-[acyl-carrier-protein] dehydratase
MFEKLLAGGFSSNQPLSLMDRIRGMQKKEVPRATHSTQPSLLFPLEGINTDEVLVPWEAIGKLIPHRGEMLLLDYVAWMDEGLSRAVAVKKLRHDEFWVHGHFPGNPIMPGALLVEAGSQLALYLANRKVVEPALGLFLRIENARFRTMIGPGEELVLLCKEIQQARNIFSYDVQGVVRNRIVFDSRIVGKLSKKKPAESFSQVEGAA